MDAGREGVAMAAQAVAPTLTGVQKTAILMIALGDQASSVLLKHLNPEQVQAVSAAIANLRSISAIEAEAVLEEFFAATSNAARVGYGGMTYAKKLLTNAFGPEGSKRHLDSLSGVDEEGNGGGPLHGVEPQLLARFLKNEHPQTVAIVLSQLNPSQAAAVLEAMQPATQAEIVYRIAKLDKVSPAVVGRISLVIGQKLKNVGELKREPSGGPRTVAEIFKQLNSELSNDLLSQIGEHSADLMDLIRQKMFVFEDLLALDTTAVKELLSRADRRLLTTALKGANDELRQHLLKGMSQRGAAMLLEDMDALGPIKIRDVEAAQQGIIAVVRQLEDEGVVSLRGSGGDEQFVV